MIIKIKSFTINKKIINYHHKGVYWIFINLKALLLNLEVNNITKWKHKTNFLKNNNNILSFKKSLSFL